MYIYIGFLNHLTFISDFDGWYGKWWPPQEWSWEFNQANNVISSALEVMLKSANYSFFSVAGFFDYVYW